MCYLKTLRISPCVVFYHSNNFIRLGLECIGLEKPLSAWPKRRLLAGQLKLISQPWCLRRAECVSGRGGCTEVERADGGTKQRSVKGE